MTVKSGICIGLTILMVMLMMVVMMTRTGRIVKVGLGHAMLSYLAVSATWSKVRWADVLNEHR